MGGIIGEYEQLVNINDTLYKYVLYGLTDYEIRDRLKYIDKLRSGEETYIPTWLYKN